MTDHESQSIADAQALLCPYCGHTQDSGRQCNRCRGLFEPLSRQATQNSMGPWQVRDESSPFTPGCSIETLRALIARGRVRPDSIVRGPTTHQFWQRAEDTPGLAHLFGACHACRASVHPTDKVCTQCGESMVAPLDRDRLGLAPVRSLSGPGQDPGLSPMAVPPPPRHPTPAPQPAAPDFAAHPFEGLASQPPKRSRPSAGAPAVIAALVAVVATAAALVILDPFSSDNQNIDAASAVPAGVPAADPTPPGTPSAKASVPAPAAAAGVEPWRASVEASAVLAASGREEDIRRALADIQTISRGFPEDQVPAELAAEEARLQRRLEQLTLQRFVW